MNYEWVNYEWENYECVNYEWVNYECECIHFLLYELDFELVHVCKCELAQHWVTLVVHSVCEI